jgi:hypothetical protein
VVLVRMCGCRVRVVRSGVCAGGLFRWKAPCFWGLSGGRPEPRCQVTGHRRPKNPTTPPTHSATTTKGDRSTRPPAKARRLGLGEFRLFSCPGPTGRAPPLPLAICSSPCLLGRPVPVGAARG